MIKIFNHYIHRRTLLQIILDFGLIIGIVVLAVGWRSPNLLLAASTALPSAALLGNELEQHRQRVTVGTNGVHACTPLLRQVIGKV